MARKHIPITIPIEGGGTCVAHVDPDASPDLVPALANIAKVAYRLSLERGRLEKAVCDEALDLLADYEMDPVPLHDPDASYGRLLKKTLALREHMYRSRTVREKGTAPGGDR
jgi:hypothetical protein